MSDDNLRALSKAIPNIIRELDAIKVRRETFIKATKARFNVFTTLRKETEEVGLHSNFLAYLLDAEDWHDCGRFFLDLFITVLREQGVDKHPGEPNGNNFFDKCLKDTFDKTVREMPISCNDKDYGRIDIGVYFEKSVIIIENKIGAAEQPNQIYNYCEYLDTMPQKNNRVLYLTKYGTESATAGDKYKDKYYRISYSGHILKWLDRCLEKTYKWPNINNVIQQYKDVVANLVGKNTLAETDMEEIEKIIKKNPHLIRYVDDLVNAKASIVDEYEQKLWLNIKNGIENEGFEVILSSDKKQYRINKILKGLNGDILQLCIERGGSDKKIWCGYVPKSIDDKEAIVYEGNIGKYESIYSYITLKFREKAIEIVDQNNNWPIGVQCLFERNNDWIEKVLEGNSDDIIKEEAIRIAHKIKDHNMFVQEEWKNAIAYVPNGAC